MQRIGFLELSHIFTNQIKLPYSTGCIWSYCKTDEEITNNYDFDVHDWHYILDGKFNVSSTARKLAECDIVGVSYFVWNTHTSDRICDEVKRFNPDCKIIYGGLGTPKYGRCQEFLNDRPYIDAIVHNEGEKVFANLLKNDDWSTVNGITTHSFQTPLENRIKNISEMPSPYLDGLFDKLVAIRDHDYEWESLIELERGCPYTCTFCEVGDRHWTKVIKQDYDKMVKEINWISDHKIDYLHLIDNNFGMYKEHKIISDLLIDKLEIKGYPNALNITWAKHKKPYLFDIAEDLWKVGLNKSVTLALQSTNSSTLKAVERANENTNLEQVIAYLKKKGMPAYIETILGLPEETLSSFKEGLYRLIDDIGYHNYIGIYTMVALPNTPFGDPEYLKKYGVKIVKTAPCFFHHEHPPEKLMEDTNDVVVGSNVMSYDDYLKACGWKWYMISVHFLGWLRILAIDLKKKYNIIHRQFYNDLFNWFIENPSTLLYKEYHETMGLLDNVFKNKIPWGREVEGASDIYWEYEEATGIHIAKEKKRFYNEIGDFLDNTYNSRYPKLVKKQANKMLDPFLVYDGNLEKYARECLWWGRRAERFFV
jgi:radical SAM superfamily enzyme YgiQ (UPF0313 family)